jgi:hypothetical protein
MHWLFQGYLERLKLGFLAAAGLGSAGLAARLLGDYLGSLFGLDDEANTFLIGGLFFAFLFIGVWIYDRIRYWHFLKSDDL